jgi:hypothetical protein
VAFLDLASLGDGILKDFDTEFRVGVICPSDDVVSMRDMGGLVAVVVAGSGNANASMASSTSIF